MTKASILDEHLRRNRTTQERWQAMAPHRARVMQLLNDARGEVGTSLCLLGVGNANDVDLTQLARDFARIVLVDLDAEALALAVASLPETASARVTSHGGIELTGLFPTLESWRSGGTPSDAEVKAAVQLAKAAPTPDGERCHAVASTCVLTQLIDSVYMGLPADDPRCIELVMAVRNRHLEMMVEMLIPGGRGVLITDFVSTETAPEIAELDDTQFPDAAAEWLHQRNFFTGANPFAIRDYYRSNSRTAPLVESVQVATPWRWDIGAKQFAVSAVTFRRRV